MGLLNWMISVLRQASHNWRWLVVSEATMEFYIQGVLNPDGQHILRATSNAWRIRCSAAFISSSNVAIAANYCTTLRSFLDGSHVIR